MAGYDQSLLHATCVAIDGQGVLLLGPPGAGKSDLALRLIGTTLREQGRAVVSALVSDDQVRLAARSGRLFASAPPTIAGRLEVRGLGIVEVDHAGGAADGTEVILAVELTQPERIERLPEPLPPMQILGVDLPLVRLDPFEPSAPQKVVLALARAMQTSGMLATSSK